MPALTFPDTNHITVAELNLLVGTPDCPDIVDICIEADFAADPFLIPGARKHPHREIRALLDSLTPGKPVVVVCQKGLKLSQGMAAWLSSEGVTAAYLEGGMFGWRADPTTLRIPYPALPAPVAGQTLWVTHHRPSIDDVACFWLIRRFVDPAARLLCVSAGEVARVAERYEATAFERRVAPVASQTHHTVFDALQKTFHLSSPALMRLAETLRDPEAEGCADHAIPLGLKAIFDGLSRQFHNDYEMVEAGISLYDALYRWARDGYDAHYDIGHDAGHDKGKTKDQNGGEDGPLAQAPV